VIKKFITLTLISLLFSSIPGVVSAQVMNHYWSLNFNSQSSLLSGAVVAGDAGNTSIYYNPATIAEIKNGSNLSFAASLFTWGVYYFKDALGNGIDLSTVSFNVQPQFMSFSYRPANSKFAFAVTAVTRMKEKFDISYYDSRRIDILKSIPGDENYNVTYKYFLDYIDNWFGFATAYDVNEHLKLGASLFLSASYLSYRTTISSIAFSPTDTIYINNKPTPSPVSEGIYNEDIKFTDYRLVLKFGASYIIEKWRFGLNITSGSLSMFSGGKEANRYRKVQNITNNETGEFTPGFVIINGQTRKNLKTQMKYPFAVSFGFIREMNRKSNRLYFTMEYFHGIKPYKLVSSPIKEDITSSIVYEQLENKDWLSVANVAKPVINFAIGYRWELSQNLMFLSGFRTDFNNINGADYKELDNYNKINTTDINIYHYTGGVQFYFLKKYLLVAGGELSFGYKSNQTQIANFADPVEYDPQNHYVLQGPIEDNMDVFYFGFNIYLSANFNFGGKSEKDRNIIKD